MTDNHPKSPPLGRRIVRFLVRTVLPIAIGTIICLLIIEVGIRVVYGIRDSRAEYVVLPYMIRNFGPPPPWANGFRILEPDDELMWRGRPHAQQKYLDLFCPMRSEDERKAMLSRFSPSVPEEFRNNPVWQVALNSSGFRGEDFSTSKKANTIRIIALGDSWTLGHNVNLGETYPKRLAELLQQDLQAKNIEVLNLGMFAYTSHEGLKLLQRQALSLQPDIVLIGFAMNDSAIPGWHDRDVFVPKRKQFSLKQLIRDNLEIYKLAVYLAQVSKFDSITLGETIKAVSDPKAEFLYESWVSAEALEAQDYERLESRVRVPPADYDRNIREMIRLVREYGALPILLHNELRPGSPYQSALQKISREQEVPLVDSCELIGAARQRIESELEKRLGLEPALAQQPTPGSTETTVVFRLFMDRAVVSKAMYIAGPHPQLGDNVPNRVAMFDDGTHGDQKAADNVWSFSATFSPNQKIFYVYTNSGSEGRWENLDVPKVRTFTVPAGSGIVYRPIESFGKLYLQADGFHTNSQGYDLIARSVRDALMKNEKFQWLVSRRGP
ncbi:MAG: GDSL-type esterase/lipase family protein [Acidobacteriota bacterium]|nr:GDSL-type esterase/lipase family protein [Acidobacteriota bacterium]